LQRYKEKSISPNNLIKYCKIALHSVVMGRIVTGTWVSQIPVETWYNEQMEIVGGDGNTIEQKRLVMLWN